MNADEKAKLILKFSGFTNEALERQLATKSEGKYTDEEYRIMEAFLSGNLSTLESDAPHVQLNVRDNNEGLVKSSLPSKFSSDANKLYTASHVVYSSLIVMNFIIGIFGVILSILIYSRLKDVGLLIVCLFATTIVCFNIYINAILSTHFGKVLSNISILIQSISKTED